MLGSSKVNTHWRSGGMAGYYVRVPVGDDALPPCICGPWCPSLTRRQKHLGPSLSFPVFTVQASGRVMYSNIVTMARENRGQNSRIIRWLNKGGC